MSAYVSERGRCKTTGNCGSITLCALVVMQRTKRIVMPTCGVLAWHGLLKSKRKCRYAPFSFPNYGILVHSFVYRYLRQHGH